jgi:hypothetical protein
MENTIENIINTEPFVGDDGKNYLKITKEILTPRRTYLKGTITGKYRGSKINNETDHEDIFDFEIYEAEVTCKSKNDVRTNAPFIFPIDFKDVDYEQVTGSIFPKEKLPENLPVIMLSDDKRFGVNLLEPMLYEFKSIRKLHQTEGNEVFGSFTAYVTGYIFDYTKHTVEEIVEKPIIKDPVIEVIIKDDFGCNWIETGKSEKKPNYIRYEYICHVHNHKKWEDWIYKPETEPRTGAGGCLSTLLTILFIGLGLFLLIKLFPIFLFFIGYYVLIALFSYLVPLLRWLFKIFWPVLLVLFLVSMFTFISSSVGSSYVPIPASVDYPEETKPTTETLPIKDSIIKRFRKWKDYEGKYYEGTYTIRLRDYNQAKDFKNNISLYGESKDSYDQIISKLKDNDNPKLYGIYHMFDSIQKANKLNPKHFAEMVVTFVQDIPYAIVLSDGCDPSLYDDRFTRNFLINNKGNCDGYQRFGINTPVEFITQLKGDCDTRTLLLYTILSHYKYDVAVMSSEFYGHSILGINLPYNGSSFNYNNQKYILWETTAFGSKPGIISNEISNTNYWRISLKSK